MKTQRLLLMMLIALSSCHTPKVVYQTQYKDRIVEKRDSIFIKEETHTSEKQRNDTIFITKERLRYIYKDKVVTDTFLQMDSIPYPKEVPVNILNETQKRQIAGFWFLLVVNIAFVAFKIYRSLKL